MTDSAFLRARAVLRRNRDDQIAACREFAWPRLDVFNWALDYFDAMARDCQRIALHVVAEDGSSTTRTFAEMSDRSNRVANFLRSQGVRRGDGILIMLGNVYGQTETTAMFGNAPGQKVKLGSMGRPLPGYRVALIDPDGKVADDGEIGVELDPPPVGLMTGYLDTPMPVAEVSGRRYYKTSDVASRDADGYYWYVGRVDDVFKSSDYRISPFELESALLEHEAVAEAAVVPSPDALRLAVPKAFIVLKAGYPKTADTARALFSFCRERLAPYLRIRRIEFCDLPKTISGKIRRVQLRAAEHRAGRVKASTEFWEDDV